MNKVETRFVFRAADNGLIKFVVMEDLKDGVPLSLEKPALEIKRRVYQSDGTYYSAYVKHPTAEHRAEIEREWLEPTSYFFELAGLTNALMFDKRVSGYLRGAMVNRHRIHISRMRHGLNVRINHGADSARTVSELLTSIQKYDSYIDALEDGNLYELPELPLLPKDKRIDPSLDGEAL